jgi:hypothetical protein
MDRLVLKMKHESKVHWRYEWPLKRKSKWSIHKLLARGQHNLLKRWPRHVESLRDEEEMVHICEPKNGKNIIRRSQRLPGG